MSSTSAPNYSTDTSILPESNDQYGTREYWDQRYAQETSETAFDWFLRPEQCLPLMWVATLGPSPVRSTVDSSAIA